MTTIQEKRAARSPEERREAFAREYVRSGGKIYASAVSAGFPAASAAVRGNELMKRNDVQERIAELLRERFVTEGMKAHAVVLGLSKRSSQKDAVKLRAAKELMTLGGLFQKSDARQFAADAAKREVQTTAEGYALIARAFAELLTVPGISSGFTFDKDTGTVKVTNADHAGSFLTNLYKGFTKPQQKPLPVVVDEEPAEPEAEDEDEDWRAT